MELELRLCEVDGKYGYFHCWEQISEVYTPSPMVGGHPGGQVSRVYGLVEFGDGHVKRVDITDIRFCDEENKKAIFLQRFY